MKYFVFFLFLIGFAGIIQISYAEEILMYLENDVRKIYYTGENINSAFFDHDSASVIFELGENATLNLKVPQVYKIGGGLFVLINGEEVSANITTDDCFYYTSFETKTPEKLEIIFAHWAEATERTDSCETFVVSPLKQVKLGITLDEIQCKETLVLIQKYDGSPACVYEKSILKLVQREWGTSENWIKVSNTNNAIHYNIDNATLTDILAFSEYKNPSLPGETKMTWLQMDLESVQDGSLQITLPRNLIDSKINSVDDGFFVLLDGFETEYHETKTDTDRTLTFLIPAKTNVVEILGYGYYNSELDIENEN